ncbi:hypothetical protein PJM27_28995, partial [Mycobacterium kansasii]
MGRAVELERNHQLTAADIAALDAFIHTCEQDAIDDTQTALAEPSRVSCALPFLGRMARCRASTTRT